MFARAPRDVSFSDVLRSQGRAQSQKRVPLKMYARAPTDGSFSDVLRSQGRAQSQKRLPLQLGFPTGLVRYDPENRTYTRLQCLNLHIA
jgi:hypothetical protein